MGWKVNWMQYPKRMLAAVLSLAMIGGTLDLTALETAAETTDQQVTVTVVEPLADESGVQQLAVGASESEIVFPDTLQATVMYAVDQAADPVDENAENIENTENTENTENNEPAENTGDMDTAGNEGDEAESGDASEITEETDYAANEAPASVTEQITLSGITWTIDAAQSDAPVFDSSEEADGACYVYTPVLPQTDDSGRLLVMGADVELPAIYVLVGEPQTALLNEGDVAEVTVGNGTPQPYSTVNDAFTAIETAINAASGDAAQNITLKFLADTTVTDLECELDGKGKTSLTIDMKGKKVGIDWESDDSRSFDFELTMTNIEATLTGTGTLSATVNIGEKANLMVEDEIAYQGTLTIQEGGTAVLENWNIGGSVPGTIEIAEGGSCTITGGEYNKIEVYSGAKLEISGDKAEIGVLYAWPNSNSAGSVKRAEIALSGGIYDRIAFYRSIDSSYLENEVYKCAIIDMLADGYKFYDSSDNETVITPARTATELKNVKVLSEPEVIVSFQITKTDGTTETKDFATWDKAMSYLSDSGNEAEFATWKKVEIILQKDATAAEKGRDVAQMVASDKLPAELVLRSAGDKIYTLSGTGSGGKDIALYTNGQNLTVENIKTNGASIKVEDGTVTIRNGADLAADAKTIDVTRSTLILENGASVTSTSTDENYQAAIYMADTGTLRIKRGAKITKGEVYITGFNNESTVVIEEGAELSAIGCSSDANNACVYCNLDSTTSDVWKGMTGGKVYFLIDCNGVTLEKSRNITEYERKTYGRFYRDPETYSSNTKIKVPDTVCSYQLTDGTKTAVDADHTFQMPSAKVTLLKHSPDASGTCPHCGKTDLATAYKNGKLQINGLTGRTYDSWPQTLTGITLTGADDSTKTLTGPSYTSGKELAQDSTVAANAGLTGADYALVYSNNINAYDKKLGDSGFDEAKAPKVTITGRGKYTGTIEYYFTIGQGKLLTKDFKVYDSLTYNGMPQGALQYGTLAYEADGTDADTPIKQAGMSGTDTSISVCTGKTVDTDGYASVAAPKIAYSTDSGSTWTEIAKNNQDTSKANYMVRDAGTYDFQIRATDGENAVSTAQSLTATIQPKSLTDYGVTLDNSQSMIVYYTGKPIIPTGKDHSISDSLIQDDGSNYVLKKGKDFTTSATNNTDVTDDAELIFTGIGNYVGTLTDTFSIDYAFELAQTTASTGHWYNADVPAVFGVDDTTGDTADVANQLVYRSVTRADNTFDPYNPELNGDVKLYSTLNDAINGTGDSYTFTGEGKQTVTLYGRDTARGYIANPVKVTVQIDQTAPTWAGQGGQTADYGIGIKENWWRTLVNKISFGHFYKDATLDLTLQANDRKSGVNEVSGIDKYYYYVDTIADATDGMASKTVAELNALAEAGEFTEVAGSGMTASGADGAVVTGLLSGDGNYVVYAYAVDRAGNKSAYICTDGLVKDHTAPEITNVTTPSKDDGTLTDTTAKISFTGSEAGTYYYILKKAGEAEPSALEDLAVKSEDQNSGRTTWTAKEGVKTGTLAADNSNQIPLTDLTAATSYVLYMAAADHAGNAGTVVSQEFTTLKTLPYIQTPPSVSGTYGETLSQMKINADNARVTAAKDNATVVSGSWSVESTDASEQPAVGADQQYTLIFTPTGSDADTYEPITCKVVPVVAKATPVPVVGTIQADAITYGDSLAHSQITGTMHRSASDTTEVQGTFTWKNVNVRPTVADSGVTEYEAVFTPTDQNNYASVENVKVKLTVNHAQHAPNMPGAAISAANSATKVSDVKLSSGWKWSITDQERQLEVGTPVTATAEYTGNDKGNYVNETVSITITRSECDHTAGEILYTGTGEHAPTCKDTNGQMADGLGHRECTKCRAVIESGIIVKAAHSYSSDWTIDVAATTTSEGSKSHHCTVCGDRADITVIPKLTNSGGGSGSGNGSGSGAGGGAGGGAVTPGQVDDTDHTNVPEQTDGSPAKLRLKTGRSTATSQKLSWKKVKGADGYEIYMAPCNTPGKKYKLKLKRTVKRSKTSYTVKGLRRATAYRYVIKAYRIVDGKKVYIAKSETIRATTKGKK